MAHGAGLLFSLIAEDKASPTFLRVAGAANKSAGATERSTGALLEQSKVARRTKIAALELTAAQERYNLAARGGVASAGQLATAQASLLRAQDRLAESNALIATSTRTMQSRVTGAGATLTRRLTLPLAALGAVSVSQAAKYQKSMTLLQTAGGETAAKMKTINTGVMKVAQQTGTSLDQLTEGMYVVAKAGSRKWGAVDQLKVLKAASEGAKAENVPLATSVSALTSVMMSYHVPASKAVAVQNELVVGAGRAKTTMQEYADALATVIPTASAAGVKFDQVAGAVATLTQHGTTAREATQELAFTIRNLQAPNNVAVSAMNQLGISSLDVAKNLGKRGLTGTISYIESKLPKSGLVYLGAMKRMASGTADLTLMQKKMSPQLAQASKQFLSGKLSAKAYRDEYKSMGAEGAAQGAQFAALSGKVKGYNDAVKNGTPAQKTLASQLKAMFGGATALNTVLQLGGENMKYFKTATSDVAKAATHAGANILGWGKTQATFDQKMATAKSNLQVFAVQLGTSLLPAVSKLATAFSGAVHWFDGLDSGQRKLLGFSALALAAIGPVLSIGGKLMMAGRGIATASTFIATRLSGMVGATEATSARIATGMTRLGGALGGAAIGLAIGELTKNASAGTKAIGALGSAAAGAAIGAAGGPVGAAIGGIAGGLTDLVTSFGSESAAAKRASKLAAEGLAAQKQAADDLFTSLKQVNGAYGTQTRNETLDQLHKKNILQLADKGGLDIKKLPDQVLAGGANDALTKLYNSGKFKGSDADYEKLETLLAGVEKGSASGEKEWERYKTAQDGALVSGKNVGVGLAKLSGLLKGNGKQLVYNTQANVVRNGHVVAGMAAINTTSALAQKNTAIIRAQALALGKNAGAHAKTGKSALQAAASFFQQSSDLRGNLIALKFNATGVDQLIGKYAKLPKSVTTQLHKVGVTPQQIQSIVGVYGKIPKKMLTELTKKGVTPADIQAILTKYNAVPTQKQTELLVKSAGADAAMRAVMDSVDAAVAYAANHPAIQWSVASKEAPRATGPSRGGGRVSRAAGGYIRGPGTGTSDSIDARLSNGEYVVRASQTKKHRRLLERINTPGFAKGGVAGTKSWLQAQNPKRYDFGAAGPNSWDCSGLVGGALLKLLGQSPNHRIFSTNNEGSVLSSYGFKRGTGGGSALMVVGWNGHHTTGSVGGLKFEAYGDEGVPLRDQIRVGGNARSPSSFPNVMHLPNGARGIKAQPGGNPPMSGGGKITRVSVDGKNKFKYGGQIYASKSAALNAQARAGSSSAKAAAEKEKQRQSSMRSAVTGAFGGIGSAPGSPQIDLSSVGIARVRAQVKHGRDVLVAEAKKGLATSTVLSLTKQLRALAASANKQLSNLRLKVRKGDLTSLHSALGKTVDDTRTAISTLYGDMSRAGASKWRLGQVSTHASKLYAAQNRLTGAKDYRSGIAGTLRGAFDPTTFGSGTDLITGLNNAAGVNNKYKSELSSIRNKAKGDKTLMAFVNQLAASGQTASLQTLAGSNIGQLRAISRAVGGYNTSVSDASGQAVVDKYGKSIDAMSDDVSDLADAIGDLAKALSTQPIVVDGIELKRHTNEHIKHAVAKATSVKKHGRKAHHRR